MKVWRDGRAVIGASDAGRAPRLPRDVQLLDGAARRAGARARSAADRRGDPPPHRRARAPLRADRARPARSRAGTPTSWSSIPRRSARRRCGCGSTCPTGAPRLYGGADGIDHVIVNGTEIVDHGEFTDAAPGHAAALRSRHRDGRAFPAAARAEPYGVAPLLRSAPAARAARRARAAARSTSRPDCPNATRRACATSSPSCSGCTTR